MLTKKTYTERNGEILKPRDDRLKYIEVPCGHCLECKRKKKIEWSIRLGEEIKRNPNPKFVTLTFTEEALKKLSEDINSGECNGIAIRAVRLFLERWRKKYKKSVKHWLITELGSTKHSERIHLHGLLWTDLDFKQITEIWQYGIVWCGKYVNQKTINYITKYMLKVDDEHQNYQPKILCSKGIGNYKEITSRNVFNGEDTNLMYTFRNGKQRILPKYYRDKIFDEDQKEELQINYLNLDYEYVNSIKIKKTDFEQKEAILCNARARNIRLGFGDNNWKKETYNACNNYTKWEKEKRDKINEKIRDKEYNKFIEKYKSTLRQQ